MIYSAEFRQQVLAACDEGKGTQEVALQFCVSQSWVRRIKQVRRETGRIAPILTRDRTPKWREIAEEIEQTIGDAPDLTLSELKQQLGTDLSEVTLCRALKALGLTLKKSPQSRRTRSS